MKRIVVVLTLAVALCFAIMAVNSNSVLADAQHDLIEKKVKQIHKTLKQKVLPRLGSVPETGQTTCYDADGNVIDCANTGQDGELQMGTKWPKPRFTDNGDGTVTDNLTGLIWLKQANCFGLRTWADALNDCNTLVAGDWRLPNVKELQSLIDYGQTGSVLPPGHPFDNVQSGGYWSSTSYEYNTTSAWVVGMGYGFVYHYSKADGSYVWPVRGGN